jgi:site-specific DNA recombinase
MTGKARLIPGSPSEGSRVALYARVSSEEQKLNQTIKGQLEEIREWARMNAWTVVDEFLDDGGSGRIAFENRPGAKRLLADLSLGKFDFVVVWKYDRLGRTLKYILNAVDLIRANGVGVKSKLDDVDLTTAAGVLQLQVQGAVAEYELKMIMERTIVGRLLKAREGKWAYGPIPYGFDFDDAMRPVPSQRLVSSIGKTEADIVREIFENIANGSSAIQEAARLNQYGVPPTSRYSPKRNVQHAPLWRSNRITYMLHNTAYKGILTIRSQSKGTQTIEIPALVDEVTWRRANDQLKRNRQLSKKNAKRFFLLRGLIVCGNCGHNFVGSVHTRDKRHKTTEPLLYYRCNQQRASYNGMFPKQEAVACYAKVLPVEVVDTWVWNEIKNAALNASDVIVEANRNLKEKQAKLGNLTEQQQLLDARLVELDAERTRINNLYIKGRISDEELDNLLQQNTVTVGQLQAERAKLRSLSTLTQEMQAQNEAAERLLQRIRKSLDKMEGTNNLDAMRKYIEWIVQEIVVFTSGEGRQKRAKLQMKLKLAGVTRSAVVMDSRTTPDFYHTDLCLTRLLEIGRVDGRAPRSIRGETSVPSSALRHRRLQG